MIKNAKPSLLIALVIVGILACSVFIYFQIVSLMSPAEPSGAISSPPVDRPPVAQPPPEKIEIPALDASDELARSLALALSEHPRLAGWLAPEDLIRRFVVSVVNVADADSPRPHIGHLAPRADFRVGEHEGALIIDPDSYARYDLIATVLDSLDDRQSIELYHHLEPLFDEAYRELGYPGGDFDRALGRAIDRVLATRVPAGNVIVKRRVNSYRFADPDLEALGPVEKHLIRMGPANARKVQAKLRLLRASLLDQPFPADTVR